MAQKSDLPPYPLREVLNVKKKRIEDAETELKAKQKALATEQEKLQKAIEARDAVKAHHHDKLVQFRTSLDEGTTSNKIQQMKVYLKLVEERLSTENKKVTDQQKQVELAEKNVEVAKTNLKARQKEYDKIETHRLEWEKETLRALELEENRQEDELGSTMFLSSFIQKKAQR